MDVFVFTFGFAWLVCMVNAVGWKLIKQPDNFVNKIAEKTSQQLLVNKNIQHDEHHVNLVQTMMRAQSEVCI